MAGDTSNPRIWEGADAYVAPVGTQAPDDVSTAWADDWLPLGLLSQDGMTEARDQTVTDHYAWGLHVRTTKSQHKRSFKVTLLEDNDYVFDLVNPGSLVSTDGTGLTTRTVKTPTKDIRAFGFEIRDGDITKRRIVPRGEVVAVGEVAYSEQNMTAYEVTVMCYPAADGTLYTEITDDPQAASNWS